VVRRVELNKVPLTETAAKIRQMANTYSIPMSMVVVDEGGVGGGVVDILRCKGFIANSLPLLTFEKDHQGQRIKANFDMLKSQCGFKLAEKINNHQVYEDAEPPVRKKLIAELEQLKQKSVDADLKKGIIPKDEIKKLIGYSPDDMDTYIMRALFDLQPVATTAPVTQTF
jgi:hypothetical protein